ncbi:Rieske 2Fe-2S domain-containing protein [Actinomadura sp. 9N215]|uniref:Rieske 2Fe-2S domain-containing protein n=1 Tax=Actinomadura sp. 9N215 TaxID=3375150 RepID=UPI0037B34B36
MMDDLEYRFLRHTWFPVARADDLDDGPVEGRILDVPLVVFRAGDEVRVADAACPHRGAALWQGRVSGGTLECPYHGWRFDAGTGRCVAVPSLPRGASPPPAVLTVYPAVRAYGHVWSCLEQPFRPLPELPGAGAPGWQFGYGRPVDLRCGMRQLTENFRDMAHFPFVHEGSMGPNVRREVAPYKVRRDGFELEWELSTDLGGTALDGNQALGAGQTLTYHVSLPMFAYIRTRFPDGGHRLVAQFATPISADGRTVRQFWVVGIDDVVAGAHGVSLPEMWEYERQIFAEDHPIVENQWPREAPLDVHGQAHTRADRYGIAYRLAYADLLAEFARAGRSRPVGAV